jgi:branched-chain amino acid transport system ATP-binding protein
MLALGRALIMQPRVVLLDEPSLGLAPLVVREIFRILRELNEKEGLTVVVVEQNANLALAAAHRAFVLETGRVVVEGATAELREHPTVRKSYLGY